MKKRLIILIVSALFFSFPGVHASAEDMRTTHMEARKKKAEILEAAKKKVQTAVRESEETRKIIFKDRTSLQKAIQRLHHENQALKSEIRRWESRMETLKTRRVRLEKETTEGESEVKEMAGYARASAKDLRSVLNLSQQSALAPQRGDTLGAIIDQTVFPGIDHIRSMTALLFDEIGRSGEIRVEKGPIVNRNGEETTADILVLGNFSAAYRSGDETGFLLYSDKSRRLFALSKLPTPSSTRAIETYMAGETDHVPIDISRGAALRQFTHRLSLLEQVPKGGPIVWPILGIGIMALLITLERTIYLARKHVNADEYMNRVCELIDREEWNECLNFCEDKKSKPIPRVLMTGLRCRDMNRQDLENALQESILNQIPRLERFLSTLGMLAAIAPLLGLLGTVTGMINTFHTITYYGTGDPRLMSGGISEALVTTMLGLSVAIPIMLVHTLLSRRVESTIAMMEEKAVSLVNTLFRTRSGE